MRQIRESQEPFDRRRAGEPAPLAQAAAAPLVPAPLIAAPIAVIGSPNSTTTFTVDILEAARDRALDHACVTFEVAERFNGRSYRKRALCQLGGIVTRNRWHEDPIIRAVIKHQGALPALSGAVSYTHLTLPTIYSV